MLFSEGPFALELHLRSAAIKRVAPSHSVSQFNFKESYCIRGGSPHLGIMVFVASLSVLD